MHENKEEPGWEHPNLKFNHKIKAINLFPMIAGQRNGIKSDLKGRVINNPWVQKNVLYNWMSYLKNT